MRHELIGLDTRVSKAINPLTKNIQGKIIDETQQTLTIRTDKGDKKILKRLATFEFSLTEAKVEVQGSELVGRPWERIKK